MSHLCSACGQPKPVQYPHPDRNDYLRYDDANDDLMNRIADDEGRFLDAE